MKVTPTTRLFARLAGLAVVATLGTVAHAQSDNRGELITMEKQMPATSTVSRADRKAETLAANKNGGLGSPGVALYRAYNVAPREALAHSTKTREERKAETMAAVRDHSLMPAGEALQTSVH